MIDENKNFIFDNPFNKYRYYLQCIKYSVNNLRYGLMLDFARPAEIEQKKYYTSICAIFKNEAFYLKEWIEYHKIVGIEHFYLYNNFSDDHYQEVLRPYVDDGSVTLIDWPVPQGQMRAYADCAKRFFNETNWIAYVDLDEFIVPNTCDNVNAILKGFEKNRPVVIAYWKLFGTSGVLNRDKDTLITDKFFMCWRKYSNIGKCFFNTAYDYADDLAENTNMHYRWARYKGIRLPPVNIYGKVVSDGINRTNGFMPPIQINHYFTKSYEEYRQKSARGDAFFELNPRDEAYFYWHEMKCQSTDYHIQKYMIKLKLAMEKL